MEITREFARPAALTCRRILGIDFYSGSPDGVIARMKDGGLLVVPAAPALINLAASANYREALLSADVAICDSSYMAMVWSCMVLMPRLLQGHHVERLSGLEYLRALLREADVQQPGNTLWIMASRKSAHLNLLCLSAKHHIDVSADYVYVAPIYEDGILDRRLLERIVRLKPRNIIITLGGGTQEKLGLYLKRNLPYLPAIHCIGAAMAFLSGDQVHIPQWADKACVGWFFRVLSNPWVFGPRYWRAGRLLFMLLRYKGDLPPLTQHPRAVVLGN